MRVDASSLAPLGAILAPLGAISAQVVAILARLGGILLQSGGLLVQSGAISAQLGAASARFGAALAQLRGILAELGATLSQLGAILAALDAATVQLGFFLPLVACILGLSWALLCRPGLCLAFPGLQKLAKVCCFKLMIFLKISFTFSIFYLKNLLEFHRMYLEYIYNI